MAGDHITANGSAVIRGSASFGGGGGSPAVAGIAGAGRETGSRGSRATRPSNSAASLKTSAGVRIPTRPSSAAPGSEVVKSPPPSLAGPDTQPGMAARGWGGRSRARIPGGPCALRPPWPGAAPRPRRRARKTRPPTPAAGPGTPSRPGAGEAGYTRHASGDLPPGQPLLPPSPPPATRAPFSVARVRPPRHTSRSDTQRTGCPRGHGPTRARHPPHATPRAHPAPPPASRTRPDCPHRPRVPQPRA